VTVFDLEKVLITPQGEASSNYNKRNIDVYHFTVYDINKDIVTCGTSPEEKEVPMKLELVC